MKRSCCVLALDAARARLFELAPAVDGRPPTLTEVECLISPRARQRDAEVQADSRPGLRRGTAGGAGHAVDDRRDSHRADARRKYAADVCDALSRRCRSARTCRAIVVASPTMLGILRECCGATLRELSPVELARDVTNLTPPELHDYLASNELLPARERYT